MDASRQDDDISAALDVLNRKLDRIDAMPGGEAQTVAIRELAEEIQKLFTRATEIRKGVMFRIRDEEKLSLAKLADRVGISKARADQLVNPDRRKRKEARDA